MPEEPEWYDDGLCFECTSCGECCTGAPGYVLFSEQDAAGIAKELGMTKPAFLKQHTHVGPNGPSLNEIETEHGHDCVFLDRTTDPGKALCKIYHARPKQCRTWPWWPENLRDPRAWQRTGRNCEGVGRGNIVPIEEIRIHRDEPLP